MNDRVASSHSGASPAFGVFAAAIVLVAGCSCALGQYANGDGRSMQKNTDRYKDKEPIKPRDLRAEVQFRNAVVTGNAPGGASFRGTAPYAGDKDFRGSLGSDDLYRFRRDSTSSGYSGSGLRGTQSLQYQFGLQTGSSQSMTVSRTDGGFAAPAGSAELTAAQAKRAGSPMRSAYDALSPTDIATTSSASNARLGAIRSTSAYASTRSLQPVYVGDRIGRDGQPVARLAASGLLGMKSIRVLQPNSAAAPGVNSSMASSSAAAGSASNSETAAAPEIPTRTMMDDARDRLSKGLGASTPEGEGKTIAGGKDLLEERLDAIRRNLQGLPPKPGAPDVSEPKAPDVAWLKPTASLVKNYVVIDRAPIDLYSIHMDAGQKLSVAGRYFDAEERYAKALSAKSGDPTAQIARVHAQVMAGMFVSAAVNLRSLVQQHPEAVGLSFDESLVPHTGRTIAVKNQCRDVIKRVAAGSSDRFTRDTGLVLAYLGFLTNDREARIDGLWALASDEKTPDGQLDRRLAIFLEQVWDGGVSKIEGLTPMLPPAPDQPSLPDLTK
jgi:hypothetical protein